MSRSDDDDVSAFVAATVRHELDRRHLHAFVEELVAELGPSGEAEVVRYSELFVSVAAAEAGQESLHMTAHEVARPST